MPNCRSVSVIVNVSQHSQFCNRTVIQRKTCAKSCVSEAGPANEQEER